MMRFLLSRLWIAALCFLNGLYALTGKEPLVLPLFESNFTEILGKDPHLPSLIEYYAPWCGFCATLEPELEKAASLIEPLGLRIFKVNCEENVELCKKYKIQGYPTMHVVRNLSMIHECSYRKGPQIANYLRRVDLIEPVRLDRNNWEKYVKEIDLAFIGVFKNDQVPFYDIYQQFASHFLLNLDCAIFVDEVVPETLRSSSENGHVLVFKKGERDMEWFDASKNMTLKDLKVFVFSQCIPLLGNIESSNYEEYLDVELPILYVFVQNQVDREALFPGLLQLAQKYRYQVTIAFIDAFDYESHAAIVGLDEGKFPAISIHDILVDRKYPAPVVEPLTISYIESHLENFFAKKISPFFLSEPIPSVNEGPVKSVVHDNFVDLIMDDSKDALLLFTAGGGCSACRRVAPLYDQVGDSFLHASDKIIIARMKVDENDMPEMVNITFANGVPILYLFPADQKMTPIPFDGFFSLTEIQKFVSNHSYHKATPASTEKPNEHVEL